MEPKRKESRGSGWPTVFSAPGETACCESGLNMELTLGSAVLSEKRAEARLKWAETGLILNRGDRRKGRLEGTGSRGDFV